MIPSSIKREHILAALAEIDKDGVSFSRHSTKFQLVYGGRKYPPKFVISLAGKHATGVELPSGSFGGGSETNRFLRERGFDVVAIEVTGSPSVAVVKSPRKRNVYSRKPIADSSHNERCPDCKVAVESLLRAIYGDVEKNHRIEASTNPEDYRQSPLYSTLSDIYLALQEHRGYKGFVRSATMPNCDFWVPNPGFVVEFDESQHFTDCRALALERYPSGIPFGFEREMWLRHCQSIRAEDHDPPFRDEQRAWYDTLRDFVPYIQGLHPTLRLFASEFSWCRLNPEKARDVGTFRQILGERANFWKLEFAGDASPILARIVIDSPWLGDVGIAGKLLGDICSSWPKGKKVEGLTTCGAFLRFDWPSDIAQQADSRVPDQEAVIILEKEGKKRCSALL